MPNALETVGEIATPFAVDAVVENSVLAMLTADVVKVVVGIEAWLMRPMVPAAATLESAVDAKRALLSVYN
jgi:hypothetical protein